MTHYDDGTQIEWLAPEPPRDRPTVWSDIIDPSTIQGMIDIVKLGDKPGRMQTADGPKCKDQYLRTISGHSIQLNQWMDTDQMYTVVSAADWPRGYQRREFYHIGGDHTVIGADQAGLQPGIVKCLRGELGRNVVNYTAGPDQDLVRLATLNKLDHSKGIRARRHRWEKSKAFNPENIYEYGGTTVIVIDAAMAEAIDRDGKFDACACGSERLGFPRISLLHAISTETGNTTHVYNSREQMEENYRIACRLGIMKDPRIIARFNRDRKDNSSGPIQTFDKVLKLTGADDLITATEEELPALPKATLPVPTKANTDPKPGSDQAGPKAASKAAPDASVTAPQAKAKSTPVEPAAAPKRPPLQGQTSTTTNISRILAVPSTTAT